MFPNGVPMERDARHQSFHYITFRAPSNGASPSRFPSQSAHKDKCSVSRVNGLSIHSNPSESPVKEHSHENRKNVRSSSTEPHVDGRSTHNWVRPGSPRGSFAPLLSLPQSHVTFSTTAYTSTWVDQSPISQLVSQ
jgi:hypothetical protein